MASQTGTQHTSQDTIGGLQLPDLLANKHDAGPAIVLSGGGAKGDFEVGAVRCLYNHGIRPKILCGTSVGSVNALKLAEGEDTPSAQGQPPAGHLRGLAGLEKMWLGLTDDSQMWSLEPGVANLFNTLKNLPKEVDKLQMEAAAVGTSSIGGVIASLAGIPGFFSFAPQLSNLNELQESATNMLETLSATLAGADNILGFANYDPLEKIMRTPNSLFLPFQKASGITLRMAMVALEDGALRYVTETNTMIERDGKAVPVKPPPTAGQIAALKDERAMLIDQIADLTPPAPEDAKHLGGFQKPPHALATLKRKLAQVNAELAKASIQYDLIRAALASSALPVICRPIPMQDGRTYIDGGIRTLAPIQAAIDASASKVYAITASSSLFDVKTLDQIGQGSPLPLLGIALRVGEQILPDEVGRRDLFPSNPWPVPVVVIQPDPSLEDIHDGLTIEPGLIRIRMAYGFMRAYDTIKAFEKFIPSHYQYAAQQNSIKGKTMEIVKLRKQIWDLEFPANGKQFIPPSAGLPPTPHSVKNLPAPVPSALTQIRTLKQQLKALVAARIAYYKDATTNGADSLPGDSNDWATHWEKHSWTPTATL